MLSIAAVNASLPTSVSILLALNYRYTVTDTFETNIGNGMPSFMVSAGL